MTTATAALLQPLGQSRIRILPWIATGVTFAILFWVPLSKLVRDWMVEPDAGHGLLLAPLAVYLAYKRGVRENAVGQRRLGTALLILAVLLRFVGGLVAELFTMRVSLVAAGLALIIFAYGVRQVLHWWLPVTLMILAIPLPVVVLSTIAFPLQLQASRMGAALLEWRQVPVLLQGNVIHLPGRTLFVTEACSGLRSLASLLSLGVLIGGLWLRYPATRLLLVLSTLPVAMFLNGVRVFLTGFLVYFVDPKLGEGFMHMTEGWIIFVVAFGILGALAWAFEHSERLVARMAS
jgi:exosortase